MKFKNTLRHKLLLFTITAISLLSITVVFSIWKNNNIFNITNKMMNEGTLRSICLLKIQSDIEKSNSYILNYALNTDQESFQNINKIWAEEINPTIEKLKSQSNRWEDEKISSQINTLLISTTTFYFTQQEITNTLSSNKKKSGSEFDVLYKSKLKPKLISINSIINNILAFEKSKIESESLTIHNYSIQITWVSFSLLLTGIVLFSGIPYLLYQEMNTPIEKIRGFINSISNGDIPSRLKPTDDEWNPIITASNKLAENLENVKTFASEVGNGNFETDINVFNNEGKLGSSLANMRESLIKVAEEDKKRNWGTNGIAQMGEILRNNTLAPDELYLNITSFLIKYVNANQGGMFLLNSETKEDIHLELVACFAFNRKKYIQKRIEIGEGLVGQAILEKDVIYITEVPNNYISITSGLGGANPRCIVIVPLQVNNEIYGAIELASFTIIESHKVDFLKKIAESIASTISTVKINERTKNLLDSSQQMTEQLRAQEEEMRQNVEELQATQEEMYRKQIEMDGQMSAINGIYLFTEFDINGYITHANELFLKTMNYSIEEIRGENHLLLIPKGSSEANSHDTFWQNLREGISQSGEFKRITKYGSEVWLVANYTPVFDTNGELIKVIQLASDISINKSNTLELKKQIQTIENSYALIEYDINGFITRVNALFLSVTGYTENELIGRHHSTFIDAEAKKSDEYKKFWKSISDGIRQEGKFKRLHKKGDVIWLEGSYNPINDSNEKPVKIISYFNPTTNQSHSEETITEPGKELLLQEEELRKNLEELKSIQEEMQKKSKELNGQLAAINNTIPLAEFSMDGIFLEANELFLKKFKLTLKEIKGKNYHTLFLQKNINSVEKTLLWKELNEKKSNSGTYTIINKYNEEINTHVTLNPVLDQEQTPIKVLGIFLEAMESKEDVKKLKEVYESRIKELESRLK